jgi:hypothetical protein
MALAKKRTVPTNLENIDFLGKINVMYKASLFVR